MSINKVVISGNLTHDPEKRKAGETPVLSFSVAVNDRKRNASGEWEDCANFIDCTLFGNRAKALADILKKGMKVCVQGRLHYSSWEKDGAKRSKVEVTAEEIEIMTAKGDAKPEAADDIPW